VNKANNQQYYANKLKSIEILESGNYQQLEISQKYYQDRMIFYKAQKDIINTKIRMLEVYQNLWGDLESQIAEQAFANEEFWNNMTFNILKYNKFIQELNESDYNEKAKSTLDKKTKNELWDQRQQTFTLMKNDISYMSINFQKMHSDIHKRAVLQRKCIEKHISVIGAQYKEVETIKERYRSVFHEIQQDIGAKGNKISKQALTNYKLSVLEKVEYTSVQSNLIELDLAW